MTNQQAPEIYTLHTAPNKGERPWSGIYAVRADAEHDAKVMRDVTGRDWSVVRLVVADTAQQAVPSAAAAVEWIGVSSHHLLQRDGILGKAGDAVTAQWPVLPQPSTTPQADSQPAPEYVGNGMFKGETIQKAAEHWANWCDVRCMMGLSEFLRVVAARAPADSVTAPAGGVDDDVDAIALARYKVVPAHESMFHRFAVVAGDGKQQLYLGREVECENMARKFAGAFLDGAFYQSNIATPPAQAAGSVLEDAARYRALRDEANQLHEDDISVSDSSFTTYFGSDLDEAVDALVKRAARKQGANHD